MRFALPLVTLAAIAPLARTDEPDAHKAWAKKVAGVWVLTAAEADGVSTAGDKTKSIALTVFPTYLTLGTDGAFERTHSNLAAVESDTGTFAVVNVADGAVRVDVSVRRKVGGDLPKPVDVKVDTRELWRLTDTDTLQRCLPAANERPTEVGTTKGDGRTLLTYSRFKPPAPAKR